MLHRQNPIPSLYNPNIGASNTRIIPASNYYCPQQKVKSRARAKYLFPHLYTCDRSAVGCPSRRRASPQPHHHLRANPLDIASARYVTQSYGIKPRTHSAHPHPIYNYCVALNCNVTHIFLVANKKTTNFL